ncbi:MAG TPA: glycosyltransferase [Thermoanaerobaculia bacterium]|jgi:N-acetylglucosaminyl-diphospho-decaprenol L-rhamnosyltransferase|nr:glycosyltransferase [Thermoanaerobaculia bacterium]
MPDLSIVIPTFNTASMTLRCCRAVLASMPDAAEVIVVDDGSSDGTAELLAREVPSVQVVRLESNRGFAPAANRGVAATRGRIIVLLNSDAIVEEGALQAILSAFDADPILGVAGGRLLNEDGSPQWSGGRTPTLAWMIGVVSGAGHLARFFRSPGSRRKHRQECLCHKRSPMWHGQECLCHKRPPMWHRHSCLCSQRDIDWVSGAAMAIRREVWEAAGPLDERYRFYCQDIDLCLRARKAGWRVAVVENARVVHAIGGTVAGDNKLHHDPEKLWSDLLDWGTAHYGRRWSVVARPALVLVAWLRIAWSSVFRRGETGVLVRAARSLLERT